MLCTGVSYFAFACLSVRVFKIPQKLLNRSTLFLVEAFLRPREETFRFRKKNLPRVRVGVGGSKFGPNSKKYEKNFRLAIGER